jgi:hypothetical protein
MIQQRRAIRGSVAHRHRRFLIMVCVIMYSVYITRVWAVCAAD